MSKLLDQESFAAYIEAATRQAGFTVEKRAGLKLYVTRHGHTLPCNVSKAYQAYQGSPHRLDDIVAAHLSVLQNMAPLAPPPTEKEAAESLLPLLQQTRWLKQPKLQNNVPRDEGTVPVFSRPFVRGVVITYIFDFPEHRAYVNTNIWAQITQNGQVPAETIHEYALENLRLRTIPNTYQTFGVGHKTMIVCETDDGYAATRVLLPDLMEKWSKRIPRRMLIGIPNRDFLIAFGERHPDRKALVRQIRCDARQRDHPLSRHLLVWENGKIREYRRN